MDTLSSLPTFTFAPELLPLALPTAVYIARGPEDGVLYVGMTGALSTRFAAHRKVDRWWSNATAVTVEMWPSRDAAAAREEQLIGLLDPPFNRTLEWREKKRAWAERDETLVELYSQGLTIEAIARQLDVDRSQVIQIASRMRKAGRIGYRRAPGSHPSTWLA